MLILFYIFQMWSISGIGVIVLLLLPDSLSQNTTTKSETPLFLSSTKNTSGKVNNVSLIPNTKSSATEYLDKERTDAVLPRKQDSSQASSTQIVHNASSQGSTGLGRIRRRRAPKRKFKIYPVFCGQYSKLDWKIYEIPRRLDNLRAPL